MVSPLASALNPKLRRTQPHPTAHGPRPTAHGPLSETPCACWHHPSSTPRKLSRWSTSAVAHHDDSVLDVVILGGRGEAPAPPPALGVGQLDTATSVLTNSHICRYLQHDLSLIDAPNMKSNARMQAHRGAHGRGAGTRLRPTAQDTTKYPGHATVLVQGLIE